MYEFVRRFLNGGVRDFFAELREARTDLQAPLKQTAEIRFFEEFENSPKLREARKRLMFEKHFFTSEAQLSRNMRADWAGVDLRIREFAFQLVRQARRRGIPLYVHTARRTVQQQAELYREGRSKVEGPVAAHTVGAAVDIVHTAFHWEMSEAEWAYIGRLGKEIARRMNLSIEWGGDWSWSDPAHWQLPNWRHLPMAQGEPVHISPFSKH